MICEPCAKGGDISRKIRLRLTAATLGRVAAVAQHQQCKGGTWCDCQHVVSVPDPRIPEPTGVLDDVPAEPALVAG